MDGIHDLGGKQGYGAIAVSGDEEPPFHSAWEARMWGIAFAYTRPPGCSAPVFRYTREQETPLRYLTRPYLDQWYQAHACMLLGSGAVTVDELASGTSDGGRPAFAGSPMSAAQVARNKHLTPARTTRDDLQPRFRVGDEVRVILTPSPGHTRVPAYVRGHRGIVHASHGGHALDDATARGEQVIEPLYTVGFKLSTLFAEHAGSNDRVHVELWESHLHECV